MEIKKTITIYFVGNNGNGEWRMNKCGDTWNYYSIPCEVLIPDGFALGLDEDENPHFLKDGDNYFSQLCTNKNDKPYLLGNHDNVYLQFVDGGDKRAELHIYPPK